MRRHASRHVKTIGVESAAGRYPVWVGAGLLRQSGRRLRGLRPGCRRLFVVSSPRVWRLWGRELTRGLRAAGISVEGLLLDDREENKRLATVQKLADELLRRRADRGAVLAALGGGVVGDITGFLAASFMRGIVYLQIPTTLVAQIDSAIGGKTGVNLRGGKNLLGAFYPPLAVLADPRTLGTLPAREFRAGLYEVVKCAIIGDPELFRFLERHLAAVLAREAGALDTILRRAIRLKAAIVSRDEREQGVRRVLNLGHTFGHALETLTGYRGVRHGEAVGWGIVGATRLAVRLGRLAPTTAERILALVHAVGALPPLRRLPAERLYALLFADKKRQEGDLRFVLPRGVGRVDIVGGIPRSTVLASLRELPGVLAGR